MTDNFDAKSLESQRAKQADSLKIKRSLSMSSVSQKHKSDALLNYS